MARTGLPGKRRGFSAYIYGELEEHHARFLNDFLCFIEWKFTSVPEFLGWAIRLITMRDSVDPAHVPDAQQRKFLGPCGLSELLLVQALVKKDFKELITQLDRGEEVPLTGMMMRLRLQEIPSGRKVYWVGPERPEAWDHRSLRKYLKNKVLWCLMHLGREVILECAQCGRHFLRSDQREARHCSQPCRLRAYDAWRREKRAAQSKVQKGG